MCNICGHVRFCSTDDRQRFAARFRMAVLCRSETLYLGKDHLSMADLRLPADEQQAFGVQKREASSGDEGMTVERQQERLSQHFFSDPTQWWDKRWSLEAPRYPDFKRKNSKDEQWLSSWYTPIWVDSQSVMWDAQLAARPFGSLSTWIGGLSGRVGRNEGNVEGGTCRKQCENGHVGEATDALDILVQRGCHIPNNVFYRLLKMCLAHRDLVLVRRLHALTVESGYEGDSFLATHLIGLYSSHGRLEEAMRVFSKVTVPSAYNWASIIVAYVRHGEAKQAIGLYRQMRESTVKADNHIFVAVLQACAIAGDLATSKDIHADILASAVEPDMFVQNSLVDMYAKCRSLEDAREVFDGLPVRDLITWNAMIAGYVQQGMGQEALSLYSTMQQEGIPPPDSITFVYLLQACTCAGIAALHLGKQLHAQIAERGFEADVVLGASLVNMYAKCGSLEDTQRVFDRLAKKDVVTWNAMITGYVHQGMGQEALSLYSDMQQEGLTPPDSATFVGLLQACASVGALPLGKHLHAQIEKQGLQGDVVVGTSLVNMYAKCGSMVDSQHVFDSLFERDVVAWGALIAGYTCQGEKEIVFDLVDRMKLEGIQPDSITFLCVLTVCSHVGLVDKGRKYFETMSTDYGINPTIEHYTCMIDLLGRAGHLDEALCMVKTMPFQPHGALWLTLLGACRKWGDVAVGQQAFEFAQRLDGKDAAAYVLMSNIYADARMWEEAKEMQARRVMDGAWKEPGRSWWTDMAGVVHSFVSGEGHRLHPGVVAGH